MDRVCMYSLSQNGMLVPYAHQWMSSSGQDSLSVSRCPTFMDAGVFACVGRSLLAICMSIGSMSVIERILDS
jgi:hypothetical protein